MADITFNCPYCEQKIEAPEELAGIKAECPECKCELHIPNKPAPPPPPVTPVIQPATGSTSRQSSAPPHFVAAKCPSCGGDLQVPDNREQVKCMYCGGAVIIRQAIQLVSSAVNLDNLMELARAALDANNPKEAYDYFTKVLEHDPKNPSAWAGKGEAAGWMSTLGNFRLTEMLAGLNNAISYADDESQSLMCERCSNTVNTVAMACFSLARNHVLEFAGVEGAWVEYLDRCETIVAALEAGLSFDPSSRTAIENIILICVRNAEGLSFKNYDNLPSSLFVSEQYESVLRARIDKYSATMKLLNPGFTKPVIQKVSSSAGWDFLRALSG